MICGSVVNRRLNHDSVTGALILLHIFGIGFCAHIWHRILLRSIIILTKVV